MEVVRNIDSLFLEAYNHSAAHLTPTNNVFGLSIRQQTVNRGHYDRQERPGLEKQVRHATHEGERKKSNAQPVQGNETTVDEGWKQARWEAIHGKECRRYAAGGNLWLMKASLLIISSVSAFSLCFDLFVLRTRIREILLRRLLTGLTEDHGPKTRGN
ncbi:uncharacterized protein ASPGLDRAFT_1003876 [Aspergillus glaucus CBS 516.65]|uniref:Uncharacterized protein n=1 Tax=Aspergillus glaucus CBS 516.65 TaxID=1160497 RepID=A0A1L9VVE0_ASPGL|nr:hypothetical protein ASPGLDRAFT_1003876 [Aspergillus glaucus CBS 516.65]OJJ87883.1 hypothetical protein ASPGLDRAFT_1003876 [Aspergillus glaucus CBS 516.65]